jgi:hypothetical protein
MLSLKYYSEGDLDFHVVVSFVVRVGFSSINSLQER